MYQSSKSSQHSCDICGKKYTRKISFERHFVVCELLHCSKRDEICEKEENMDIPTLLQLYKIIQELATKNAILEKKVDAFTNQMIQRNKKINVIVILNSKPNPIINFHDWIQTIEFLKEDINTLITESVCQTILNLIKKSIDHKQQIPICCFQHKSNTFYIFENTKDKWIKMETSVFSSILKQIHYKILLVFTNWYSENNTKNNQSDKEQIIYSNTLKKLMSTELDETCPVFNKLKNGLFAYLNTKFEY